MVSKSGTNELHGSVFYDFTNNDMRGDTIEGRSVFVPEFEEKRYGVSFGGPIIEDTLFFFGAYERFEGVNLFGRGPVGSGATTIVTGFTQAEYDRSSTSPAPSTASTTSAARRSPIRRSTRNTSPASTGTSTTVTARRFTYNYNKGLNLTESDTGSTNFEFGKHLYDRGAELKAYSGQL